MSTYNSAQFLERCIDSILGQTLADFEFLVVDDGSTDDTRKILDSYDDPRMVVFHQPNEGLTVTLNRLLGIASGKFVARQDADDFSYPTRLEQQHGFLDAHPEVALVGSWSTQIDDYDNPIHRFEPETRPEALSQILLESNPFTHGSWFVRREVMESLGGYRNEFRYSQDYDLLLRMSEKYRMANIPEMLYAKRHTRGMVSVGNAGTQSYFGELARRCWRERADFGVDHISNGQFVPPDQGTVPDTRSGVVSYHKHLISMWSRKGDAARVRREIRALFRISPIEPFAWMQYLLSLGGGRLLRVTADLWDGLRRE